LKAKIVGKINKNQLPNLGKDSRNILVVVNNDSYFINGISVDDFSKSDLKNLSAVLFHEKDARSGF
jgi:phenylpyruvate tautomerase PptA (4-oxalocrotonate tautomerase family)